MHLFMSIQFIHVVPICNKGHLIKINIQSSFNQMFLVLTNLVIKKDPKFPGILSILLQGDNTFKNTVTIEHTPTRGGWTSASAMSIYSNSLFEHLLYIMNNTWILIIYTHASAAIIKWPPSFSAVCWSSLLHICSTMVFVFNFWKKCQVMLTYSIQ